MAKIENSCRLCIKNTSPTVFLSDKDSDKITYLDKLKYIFKDVVLEEDNKTPFKICQSCCKKLKQTFEFKKYCNASYEHWKLHFQNNQLLEKANIATSQIESLEEGPKRKRRGRPPKKLSAAASIEPFPKSNVSTLGNIDTNIKIKQEPEEINSFPTNDDVKPNVFNMKNKLSSILQIKQEPISEMNSFLPPDNDIKPNVLKLKNKLNTLLKPELNTNHPPIKLNFLSLKNKLDVALKNSVEYIEEKNNHKTKPKKKMRRVLRKFYYTNHIFYVINKKNKTFYCNSCKKHYRNIKSLKYHIIKDLRIKNLSCHLCSKQFFYMKNLQNHWEEIHGRQPK